MNFTLLITVLVTALTLVVAAYVVAKLIGPRSYAKVKGEPYESGIPTRGSSWLPMSVPSICGSHYDAIRLRCSS